MRIVTIFSTALLAVQCLAAPSKQPGKANKELNNALGKAGEASTNTQTYLTELRKVMKDFDTTTAIANNAIPLLSASVREYTNVFKENRPEEMEGDPALQGQIMKKYDQVMVSLFGDDDSIPGIFRIVKSFLNVASKFHRVEAAMKDKGISVDQKTLNVASKYQQAITEKLNRAKTIQLTAISRFFSAYLQDIFLQLASNMNSLVKETKKDDPQVLPANYQMFLGNLHGQVETYIAQMSDIWKKLTSYPGTLAGLNMPLIQSSYKLLLEMLYRIEWETTMQVLAENSDVISSSSNVASQQITFGEEDARRGMKAFQGMLKQLDDIKEEWEKVGVAQENKGHFNPNLQFNLKYPLSKEESDQDEDIYKKIEQITVGDQLELKKMASKILDEMPKGIDILYDADFLRRFNQFNNRVDSSAKAYYSLWNNVPRFEKLRNAFLNEDQTTGTAAKLNYLNTEFDERMKDAIRAESEKTDDLMAKTSLRGDELSQDEYLNLLEKSMKLHEALLEMPEDVETGPVEVIIRRFKILADYHDAKNDERQSNEEKEAKRKKNQEKRAKRKGKKAAAAATANNAEIEQIEIPEIHEQGEIDTLLKEVIKHEEPSIPEAEETIEVPIEEQKETEDINQPALEEEVLDELIAEEIPEEIVTREPAVTTEEHVVVGQTELPIDLIAGDMPVPAEEIIEVKPITFDDDDDIDWIPVKAKERAKEKIVKEFPFRRKYDQQRTDHSVQKPPKYTARRKHSDKTQSHTTVLDDKNQYGSQSSPSNKKYGRTSTSDWKSSEQEVSPPNSQLWPPLIPEELITIEDIPPNDKADSKESILENIPEVEDVIIKEDQPMEVVVPEDTAEILEVPSRPSEKVVDPAIIKIGSPVKEPVISSEDPALEKAEYLVNKFEAGLRTLSRGSGYTNLVNHQGKRLDKSYILAVLNPAKRELGEAKLWLDAASMAVSTILGRKETGPNQQRIDDIRAKWLAANLSFMKYAKSVAEAEERLNTALVTREAKRLDELREAILENVSEVAQGHEQLWEQTKATRRSLGDVNDVAAHFMSIEAIERVEKNAESVKRDREILKQILELTKKLGKPPGEH